MCFIDQGPSGEFVRSIYILLGANALGVCRDIVEGQVGAIRNDTTKMPCNTIVILGGAIQELDAGEEGCLLTKRL